MIVVATRNLGKEKGEVLQGLLNQGLDSLSPSGVSWEVFSTAAEAMMRAMVLSEGLQDPGWVTVRSVKQIDTDGVLCGDARDGGGIRIVVLKCDDDLEKLRGICTEAKVQLSCPGE